MTRVPIQQYLGLFVTSLIFFAGVAARPSWLPDLPGDNPDGTSGDGGRSENLPDFSDFPLPCPDGNGTMVNQRSDSGDGGSSWLPGVNCTGGNWTINLPGNATWPDPFNLTGNISLPWGGGHGGDHSDPGQGIEWLLELLGNLTQGMGGNGTSDPFNMTWPWEEGANGTWPFPCGGRHGRHGMDMWNCTEGNDILSNLTCNNGTISLPCTRGFPFLPCENGTIQIPCSNSSNSSLPLPWVPPHGWGFPKWNWTEELGNLTCQNGTIKLPCVGDNPLFPCENGTITIPCNSTDFPFGNWSLDNSTLGNWGGSFNLSSPVNFTDLLNCTNGSFPVQDFLDNIGGLLFDNFTLPGNLTFRNWTIGDWSLGNFTLGNLTLPCPVLNLTDGIGGILQGTGDASQGQSSNGLDSTRQGNANADGSLSPQKNGSRWLSTSLFPFVALGVIQILLFTFI